VLPRKAGEVDGIFLTDFFNSSSYRRKYRRFAAMSTDFSGLPKTANR
jgi:hypothetical protein